MKKKIIFNALKVSAIIGTLLNLINNYDEIFFGDFSMSVGVKVFITYLIPFSVSFYSSRKALIDSGVLS
ncbi:MAG: nitrate/nitrite transporter NrtS [Bacteroidetes bacterium]|nr:nitrate/nitrite transporter NrtS [Bacteroidota bacterium]